ncbi:MAG: arylsulfatase [Planctomycetota bacterium]|nr:arylsulfatase [Planctomycetota bacterium]
MRPSAELSGQTSRREFIRSAGLSAALLVFSKRRSDATTGAGKPNIIFIMADDLGYGHLGCYGQTKIRTPHLNRMAAEGTKFTQVYAGHCVCAPSRSVLMTGKHTGHTSVRANSGGLSLLPEDITVAEVLKKAGYATGIFGKWGLGDHGTTGVPYKQGFDEFYGYLHQVHAHFFYPWFLWRNDQRHVLAENNDKERKQYSHDLIVDESLDFIRRHRENPFFLYVPFTIPHFELLVPADSLEEYKGEFSEPIPYVDSRRHYADQPAPRTTFAAMITRMDRDVGRIFDLLKELKLDDNTIVFFTSDNGGYRLARPGMPDSFRGNGPLRGNKGTFYEGGIRVPMIVRWPGKVASGATDDFIWAFWDVMPTLAELAHAKAPLAIDGISVTPRLLGKRQEQPERFLYWEKTPQGKGVTSAGSQAVRWGKWKAVRLNPRLPLELYDLEADIGEKNNIARKYPEVIKEIEEYLKTARTVSRSYPAEKPSWGYDRLETGYVK